MSQEIEIHIGSTGAESYVKINGNRVRTKEVNIRMTANEITTIELQVYAFEGEMAIEDYHGFLLTNQEIVEYEKLKKIMKKLIE